MKNNQILKLAVGVLLLVAVFLLVRNVLENKKQKPLVQETPSPTSELKEVQSGELSPEQLEEYYQTYKNPFVVYLRKALNAYLAGDTKSINIASSAINKEISDGTVNGLDSFDKDYYQSKFVVLTFAMSIAGGVEINIMFQDRPDRVFRAWVYDLADGNYELRGFSSEENIDSEKIKEMNRVYKQFLEDKEHAL